MNETEIRNAAKAAMLKLIRAGSGEWTVDNDKAPARFRVLLGELASDGYVDLVRMDSHTTTYALLDRAVRVSPTSGGWFPIAGDVQAL